MTRGSCLMRVLALAAVVPLLLLAPGCSDDDAPATPAIPTHFEGIITNGTETGSLVLDVVTAVAGAGGTMVSAAQTLVGTLTIAGGATYDVSCILDGSVLQCTAGPYSLAGTLSGGGFQGQYTGPAGDGVLILLGGAGGSITVYCGQYGGTDEGTFNIVRNGNVLVGVAVSSSGDGGAVLSGSVSGSDVTLSFEGGSASGTIEGSSVYGSWETTEGDFGEWYGSTDACSAGPS